MNERKIFYYKILTFLVLLLFGLMAKLAWFNFLVLLGFGISFAYDLFHWTKYRYLPRYNDSDIINFSNKAARNSFFIIMVIAMATMVYLDRSGSTITALQLITPLFAFSLFVYGANYLYYRYNSEEMRFEERDYYLPRALSVALVSFAFYLVKNAFVNFNVTLFFLWLIPGTTLLLLSLFAWRNEKLGGLLFLITGAAVFTYFVWYYNIVFAVFGIAIIVNGLMFLILKVK